MEEAERRAWHLLVGSGIAPSKWVYHGKLVGAGATEHSFIHKETHQEIFLVEREEMPARHGRSYLWFSSRTNSDPPSAQPTGLSGPANGFGGSAGGH